MKTHTPANAATHRGCRRKTVALRPLIHALAGAATFIFTLAALTTHAADNIPPFLHSGPSLTQAPEAATAHVKSRWMDRNGDGWDDLWSYLNRIHHHDTSTDTDGDTVSDYQEMLHWRDPHVKGPPLGWPFYTVAQLMEAKIAREAQERTEETRLARRRGELRRKAGREIAVDHVTGKGLSLAQVDARRMQTFRTRVAREKPLKEARLEQARQYLKKHGMPELIIGSDGSVIRFANERDGKPVYYGTQNAGAADTISADEIIAPAGYALTGAGVRIGHFDTGNALFSHPQFPLFGNGSPRIRDMELELDLPNPVGALEERRHSTHTAGTIIAAGSGGQSNVMGIAREATLESFDWRADALAMGIVASNENPDDDFPISNHSYGNPVGWEIAGNGVVWYGAVYQSETTLSFGTDHGRYTMESSALDEFVESAVYTLPVFAAGNDRDDLAVTSGSFYMFNQGVTCTQVAGVWDPYPPPPSDNQDGGYFTIRPQACARNVLTVGSCAKIPGGFPGPTGVQISAYSNWGPTRGFIMKPDVVAPGEGLYSTWIAANGGPGYSTSSGTSMAAPTATALGGLLVEHYRRHYGNSARLWASTQKGLLIHTADDLDSDGVVATHPDGPDYRTGNGMINGLTAANLVEADGLDGNHPFIKQVLTHISWDNPPQYFAMPVTANGGPMRITICYSDVPGPPDPNIPGDTECYGKGQMGCDVCLLHPTPSTAKTFPWTLNFGEPSAPASKEYFSTENVQVIDVSSATAGEVYTLRLNPYPHNPSVSGTSWGEGALAVSIILSGAQAPPAAEFKITHVERVSTSPHVFSLEWPTIPGHFYRLETSTDLINWTRAKKPEGAGVEIGDLSPAGMTTTAEVLAESSNTRQFWRVKKLQPWDISP